MNDEENEDYGEYVWPPQRSSDMSLLNLVIEVIGDYQWLDRHRLAWEVLFEPGLAIEPHYSLVEELYMRSGSFSKPFLDLVVGEVFRPQLGLPTLQETLRGILIELPLDGLEPDGQSIDDSIRADQALELYRGCVWEIAAMFACVLLHVALERTGRPQASCGEPADRAHFIRESVSLF
jgi:hypothetical protein